jgi:hypothetical protein
MTMFLQNAWWEQDKTYVQSLESCHTRQPFPNKEEEGEEEGEGKGASASCDYNR